MKIKSLSINGNAIKFGGQSTLIYSEKNSVGKTTLIRLLLYTLGYPIPSTKGLRFSKMNLSVDLEVGDSEYTIHRNDSTLFVSNGDQDEAVYNVKNDFTEIQSIIYSISEPKILDSILGLHYFDQEKGWTLLNRGKVVGNIRFSVETFIEGLTSSKLSDLNVELASLKREQRAYRQIREVLSAREEVSDQEDSIEWSPIDKLQSDLRSTEMEIRKIQNSMAKLQGVKKDNSRLISLIEGMNVRIKTTDGTEERVTKENIIDFDSNQALITAQIARYKRMLDELSDEGNRIRRKLNSRLSLIDVDSQMDRFNLAISDLSISTDDLDKILKNYTDNIRKINIKIKNILQKTDISSKLYSRIIEFSKKLGVEDMLDTGSDFIFTSNLKRYSGAKLHLLVFAYRLALLKEVQERFGETYPIILDSPLSGELDIGNLTKMLQLIHSDFSKNQLIIATIYDLTQIDTWDQIVKMNDGVLNIGS